MDSHPTIVASKCGHPNESDAFTSLSFALDISSRFPGEGRPRGGKEKQKRPSLSLERPGAQAWQGRVFPRTSPPAPMLGADSCAARATSALWV